MKLIINISEEYYRTLQEAMKNHMESLIGKIILNGTPIPDNATFGDVIEKITNKKLLEDNKDANYIIISTKLWNAPYKKGGKE